MSKTADEPAVPRQTGMTPGVRTFVDSGKLPSGRQYRWATKEVSQVRERLITKYGDDKIEPNVLAMVDSAAEIDAEKVARPAETGEYLVERARRLYTIIVDGVGDDEDSVMNRVCIVRELEKITGKQFRNTAEFHRELGAYLARKSRIKEMDGARLRRARKRAKLTRSSCPLHTAAGSVSPAFLHGFPRATTQGIKG